MGLSRRQFTNEFKLAAVCRLEQGVSIAEAARALEVSAIYCTRGVASSGRGRVTHFPAMGRSGGRRDAWPNWSEKSASRP
jgi:hypothetical protein